MQIPMLRAKDYFICRWPRKLNEIINFIPHRLAMLWFMQALLNPNRIEFKYILFSEYFYDGSVVNIC